MPITLGCPSCGKRFRARDESAGKKVKCPYCQAAVQVEANPDAAGATAAVPEAPPREPASGSRPAMPGGEPPIAPADWGAAAPVPVPPPARPAPVPPPAPDPAPFPPPRKADRDKPKEREKERPRPRARDEKLPKPPERVLAEGWTSVRRGLFWVQFALLWLALVGFVGLGKSLYERQVGPLPRGDGADWVSIPGFVNTNEQNSIPVRKEEMIDLAAYGVPVLFASILLVFGRLVASGGPRMSGSRGLLALSSLFTLLAFVAIFGSYLFAGAFKDESELLFQGFVILAPMAELWFFVAIAACGAALRRPAVPRAVGAVVLVAGLIAFGLTLGWRLYVKEMQRPKQPGADIILYEQAAFAIGWLLLIAAYWRAVRGVRVGAREYIDTVETRD